MPAQWLLFFDYQLLAGNNKTTAIAQKANKDMSTSIVRSEFYSAIFIDIRNNKSQPEIPRSSG
jgi:hypothetical protein